MTRAEAKAKIQKFDSDISFQMCEAEDAQNEAEELVSKFRRFIKRHAKLFTAKELKVFRDEWPKP